jgi:NRAMP (natural resistance-associated macrophage protein)-like metal ion transporter
MSDKRKSFLRNIVIFLAILGPGIITGSVDNDAGGITTYSVAGAKYGYQLLWTLIPAFIALLVIQEMNARMGIVTGKGLADLIRENFGVKITFFIFLALVTANIGNIATEFAGVAGSMQVFGISKYIAVPLVGVGVWILVVKGSYKLGERIFLLFSVFLLCYVISALAGKPHWGEIGSALIRPKLQMDTAYISIVIGLIGTTIAPWMQFYMQSAVIEKGIKIDEYKYAIWDVVVGCVLTVVVAFFIIVACASTLHVNNVVINEAKDAAMALKPLGGAMASEIFAFGLFIASVFSATILPLSTAFFICEAFGFEAGIDKKLNEAPEFFGLFTFILVTGLIIILIPNAPLIAITIWSQVLNGALLPPVLIAMIIMVNKKELMGEYVNNKFQNTVGWITIIVLILLTTFLLGQTIIQNLLKL